MIADTSALVAVIRGEPEAEGFLAALRDADDVGISAATYLELGIVVDRVGDPVLSRRLDELLTELGIEIVPVDASQARLARQAYRDFGKGTGHRAGLNYGDCFSYAAAVASGRPLLFKGDDFPHTDVRVAVQT